MFFNLISFHPSWFYPSFFPPPRLSLLFVSRCRRESRTGRAAAVGGMWLHKRSRQASPLCSLSPPVMQYSWGSLHQNCVPIPDTSMVLPEKQPHWPWRMYTPRLSLPKIHSSAALTHTLKNKDSLLAFMVPWITFNVYGTYPLHKIIYSGKRFFRLLKTREKIQRGFSFSWKC